MRFAGFICVAVLVQEELIPCLGDEDGLHLHKVISAGVSLLQDARLAKLGAEIPEHADSADHGELSAEGTGSDLVWSTWSADPQQHSVATCPKDGLFEPQHSANLWDRTLLSYSVAQTPIMYPAGGTFAAPVGVTLAAGVHDVIYYTTDGTTPTHGSPYVMSEGHVGIMSDATLSIMASPSLSADATYDSAVTTAQFSVFAAGKCGRAYYVPYFNTYGHSGTMVEVDLYTANYATVRLHGVYTDFADFYSKEGIGPYTHQVYGRDMSTTNPLLRGYWGGFSAVVDGQPQGYLVPYFNGLDYHGLAVKVDLPNFQSTTASPFTVLDLEAVDPDLKGFSGGFYYNKKVYYIPGSTGSGTGLKMASVNASSFSRSSVQLLDLSGVDPTLGAFSGGFSYKNYGVLVPHRTYTGPVGGVNTNLTADGFWGYNFFTGSTAEVSRSGGCTEPQYSGKLVMVDLSTFAANDVQVLDLTLIDPDLRGFMGGFVAGKYGYLMPFKNKDGPESYRHYCGKLVRVDLENFGVAGVQILDLTQKSPSLRGFIGGFAYGQYAALVPHSNGNTTYNYRSRAQHGEMVFVDLNDFTVAGVHSVDLSNAIRQQIPSQADADLRGFLGGFVLGHHAYVTPHFNGVFFGKLVRLDMRDMLTLAQGVTPSGHDGLQEMDMKMASDTFAGFSGAFHSWNTSCG